MQLLDLPNVLVRPASFFLTSSSLSRFICKLLKEFFLSLFPVVSEISVTQLRDSIRSIKCCHRKRTIYDSLHGHPFLFIQIYYVSRLLHVYLLNRTEIASSNMRGFLTKSLNGKLPASSALASRTRNWLK